MYIDINYILLNIIQMIKEYDVHVIGCTINPRLQPVNRWVKQST